MIKLFLLIIGSL